MDSSDDRIVIENVNVPGSKTRVSRAMYDAMRQAKRKVLPTTARGLTQSEIRAAVVPHLPQDPYAGGAKAGWWAKAVQLDLEAKGTLVREPAPLHPEAEVTLLRAAQEALTNVRKHAQARQVSVTLSYMGDQVTLNVQDDGVGCDASAPTGGGGLAAMRQRVGQLGGAVVVESAPGRGTTAAVTLPLQPS